MFVANIDRDFLILVLFILYERNKGTQSFWHPYLDVVDPGLPACYWDEAYLGKIDCPELRMNLESIKEKIESDWSQLQKVILLYPDVFGNVSRELFVWAFQFVGSRSFGWGLPSTSLIPLADAFNHRDLAPLNISLVHKGLHL